jgi:hypothetical protein
MKLEFLKNNHIVLLTEFEFYYRWQTHIIDKWFITNWGTVPRILWMISHPFLYPYLIAFIIHDFMRSNKFKWEATRKECDEFFLYNISLHNKLIWILFYIWVRLSWGKTYKKDLPFDKSDLDKLKI